ncbi:hypothetical protein RMATCC62417_18297 [Rhizopus microsporus]|nr:hypothetical protein RMATCC62417_18297 [Rhizopus microsporus]
MVLHKDSKWKESWSKFKEESPIMQGIFRARKNYEESDNLFISYTRAFTDRVSDAFGSIFEESDQAQAIRAFQMIDPTFNMDKFMVDARTYIVPELMEAYLKGDVDTLKLWCSEATYNVLTAVIQAQVQQGLISDCKIQDLRDIELVAAKILENDVPVLVLSFRTQEIIVFRNARTDKVRQDIQALQWAIVDRVDAVTILQETEAQVMDMLKQKLAEFIETMEVPIGNISPAMIKHDQVRVVVVGGGFTGFTVASILDQMPRFYVTLIDTKGKWEYFLGYY